jgi:WD40 repeat protein
MRLIGEFRPHTRSITGLLFSSDGTHIVTSSLDASLVTHDLIAFRAIYNVKLAGSVTKLEATPDGSVIAAGLDNGNIQLFDSRTDHAALKIEAHVHCVSSLKFNIDSNFLATGGTDLTVNLFDIRDTLQSCAKFHRHLDAPLGLCFDEDGRLWSATRAGELQAWDCTDGRLLVREQKSTETIFDLAYSKIRGSVVLTSAPSVLTERPLDQFAFPEFKELPPVACFASK